MNVEPSRGCLTAAEQAEVLRHGELTVEGRLVDASNATLYCTATLDDVTAECVYKPVAGERPLWDFPTGTLANREYATWLVSAATGWDLVPTTVLRDGPFGRGMVQWWVEVDETVDLVALVRSEHPDLRRMAVLDAVINNADRKGGHLMPLTDGRVLGIDHGVTFGEEYKLRTLLWQWEGDPLDDESVDVLARVADDLTEPASAGSLAAELAPLLSHGELRGARRRVARLRSVGRFPSPPADWPALPWPPF
jgi:uncharacterized repeat protein (TIGR03843 family)